MKVYFDKLCQDKHLVDPESYFHVLNTCLDIVIQRFISFQSTVYTLLQVIQPETLCTATDNALFLQANQMVYINKEDITSAFPRQVLSFYEYLRESISRACGAVVTAAASQ